LSSFFVNYDTINNTEHFQQRVEAIPTIAFVT